MAQPAPGSPGPGICYTVPVLPPEGFLAVGLGRAALQEWPSADGWRLAAKSREL